MDKKINRFKLFRFICLICYVICIAVLIIESCMDGDSSSKQSDAVGGSLANIVNDIGGDQTVVVNPKEIKITNKIEVAKVNETYQLEVEILPENTTNKSILYTSSNEYIAGITPDGKITFLKEGEVIITATSAKDDTLTDSCTINVSHIEVDEVDIKINNNTPSDLNILYLNYSYQLMVNYYPENATNNNISFKTNNNSYLSVSNTGIITPLNYSNGKVTTITIKVGNVEKELNFITEIKDKVDLISIIPEESNYSIYVTETKKINFNFNPANATFKEYILTSSDSSICSVQNSTIKGLKPGNVVLTATSKMNSSITTSFNVEVKKQENIQEFNLTKTSTNLNIGSSFKITVKIITPNIYALPNSLTYSSSDSSVASVSQSGLVKALKEGTTTITVKNADNSCIKEMTITVIKYTPPTGVDKDTTTTDMDIKLKTSKFFYTNESYNLNNIIEVTKFYNKNNDTNYVPTDKRVTYHISNTTTSGFININEAGEYVISVEHIASGINKTITIIFIDKLEIYQNEENITTKKINLLTNQTLEFKVLNNPNYHIELIDNNLGVLETLNKNNYLLTPYNTEGVANITITPLYNNDPIDELSISLKINIYQIKTTSIDIELVDTSTNDVLIINDDKIDLNMNQSILIKVILDENVSISNVTFKSNNHDILEVNKLGEIILKKQGAASVIITDEISSLSKSLVINVYNIIKLNTENPITLIGKNVSYDKDTNTYDILNGHSGTIKLNFTDDTTYKIVHYKSSNQKVLTIGDDGSIIPHKKGTSTVTLIINDGMTKEIKIELKIKVVPQKVVNNLSNFLHKVRKGIGHFGAFLVFGIFSTFTFLLYFRYKKWFFSVPLCFVQGFGIAALTEYIQTFVPGRCGLFSDVIIDFSGFCCSAVLLSIIILLIYLRKYLKNKKATSIKD